MGVSVRLFRLDIVCIFMLSAPVLRRGGERSHEGSPTESGRLAICLQGTHSHTPEVTKRPTGVQAIHEASCRPAARRSAANTCLPWVLTRSLNCLAPLAGGDR